MLMKNQAQIITYVDRLTGGGIPQLNALLNKELAGVFGGAPCPSLFQRGGERRNRVLASTTILSWRFFDERLFKQ
jgi:hypothetical protein